VQYWLRRRPGYTPTSSDMEVNALPDARQKAQIANFCRWCHSIARKTDHLTTQVQHLESIATRMQNLEETFLTLQQQMSADAQRTRHAAESLQFTHDAWYAAPLKLRLQFASNTLPSEHFLQPALKGAVELEDLRRRGNDLENWITRYPIPFADAIRVIKGVAQTGACAPEHLAIISLQEAEQALETALQALGLKWITCASGDRVTQECEVVGEESAPVEAGRVARMLRPGIHWRGFLHLPMQVLRATERQTLSDIPPAQKAPTLLPLASTDPPGAEMQATPLEMPLSRSAGDPPPADRTPEWLRRLQQESISERDPVVTQIVDSLAALVAWSELSADLSEGDVREKLRTTLQSIRPFLPPRSVLSDKSLPSRWATTFMEVREPLLQWLYDTLAVETISPTITMPYDPETMEVSELRRTAHPHEDRKVAKVERLGLQFMGQVLFPARVHRYELGERV